MSVLSRDSSQTIWFGDKLLHMVMTDLKPSSMSGMLLSCYRCSASHRVLPIAQPPEKPSSEALTSGQVLRSCLTLHRFTRRSL
jgi:hypothetical protein